jgi:hypothetical protein
MRFSSVGVIRTRSGSVLLELSPLFASARWLALPQPAQKTTVVQSAIAEAPNVLLNNVDFIQKPSLLSDLQIDSPELLQLN